MIDDINFETTKVRRNKQERPKRFISHLLEYELKNDEMLNVHIRHIKTHINYLKTNINNMWDWNTGAISQLYGVNGEHD